MKYLSILLLTLLASISVVGCDVNEGPLEETGETVDQSIEDAQDATEDAADDVQDSVD